MSYYYGGESPQQPQPGVPGQPTGMGEAYGAWPFPPPAFVSPRERQIAMWSHLAVLLGAFAGLFVSFFFVPLFLVLWVIPLVMRSSAGDRSVFVRAHATESLNFELTTLLVAVVSLFLALILVGFLVAAAWSIFYVAVRIIATLRARDGLPYQYPLVIRFVR